MAGELPPSKALPYVISLISAVGGAVLMYWSIADRMEKQITEKVNLVSRVAELGAKLEGFKSDLWNLRGDVAAIRNTQSTVKP